MKYECVKCKKLFDESEIIMAKNTSITGSGIDPYCNECYKKKGESKGGIF